MANIQHLYRGVGAPSGQEFKLDGDSIGNHLYQDTNPGGSLWISSFYVDDGEVHHDGWSRLVVENNINVAEVGVNDPKINGQFGYDPSDNSLYIAMKDPDEGYTLRWRSTGITLGDWYATI